MVWGRKKKEKPEEPEELIDDGVDEFDDGEWEEFDEEEDEPKGTRKERFLKGLRSAAIAASVMILIAVGAGAGYIWYMGEHSPPDQAAMAQSEPVARKKVERRKRDPNAPFGASVQMLSTPVVPGSNAEINVKSVEGVNCKIAVEINKVPLKDSGLVEKPTDEYGVVTWSWTVPADAQLGKWPVEVTCISPAKKSAMVQGTMEIVKTLPED